MDKLEPIKGANRNCEFCGEPLHYGMCGGLRSARKKATREGTGRPLPIVVTDQVPPPQTFREAMTIIHIQQRHDDDCMTASIAMVLGLPYEDVPRFEFEKGSSRWDRAGEWLASKGFGLVSIPMRPPSVQQAISRIKGNTQVPVIFGACCSEDNPDGHCIVVTPERVHDPAYDRAGVHCLGATHTNGEVWVMVIVPNGKGKGNV